MEPTPHGDLVRRVLQAARTHAGNAEKLAAQLQDLGIAGEHGRAYSQSAVSNWIRGRTMPPADVLVAAAEIAKLPLLGRDSSVSLPPSWGQSSDLEGEQLSDGPEPILARVVESARHGPVVDDDAIAVLRSQIDDLWDAVRDLQRAHTTAADRRRHRTT
ncbi:MAG: hypothetical protein ACREQM_02410 [Candidatus Dormibacteraceae bacterium]